MSVINSAIFLIWECFPHRKEEVKRLFRTDIAFKTLCEDFYRCREALQYWDQSTKTDAVRRKEEYRALQRQLQNEISRFLNEAQSKFCSPQK